jgi:transposase-like protein
VPEDQWPKFKARVQAAYQALSRAIAGDLAAGVVADYAKDLPSAIACFENDFEACIAHLGMPVTHRRAIRTTNLLERLFLEERRRLKIIPNAFGERPVLKLMFGAMVRAADRWRHQGHRLRAPPDRRGKRRHRRGVSGSDQHSDPLVSAADLILLSSSPRT